MIRETEALNRLLGGIARINSNIGKLRDEGKGWPMMLCDMTIAWMLLSEKDMYSVVLRQKSVGFLECVLEERGSLVIVPPSLCRVRDLCD